MRETVEFPLEVTCQEVHARILARETFLLLDVREPREHDTVHLSQATLIPMSQLAERVGELESFRETDIVVYCHHGGRSLRVTQWLRNQGFSKCSSLAGGIDQWAIEIDPSLSRY